MKPQLTGKALVAAGHLLAKQIGPNTPLKDISALISSLATHLDVALVRGDQLQQQVNQLGAELAHLNSGPQGFFSYDSDSGFDEHSTADEAMKAADAAIDYYRGDACDGWSEEVGSVCWGIIMQKSTEVNKRDIKPEDKVSSHCSHWCDFALLPAGKTSHTDVFLLNAQADGIDNWVADYSPKWNGTTKNAEKFAANLRVQATALQQKDEGHA